jgi:hypothetical protein
VQRDDHKIPRRGGRRNEWKELRCGNRTHSGIFGSQAALNKAKGSVEQRLLRRRVLYRPLSSAEVPGPRVFQRPMRSDSARYSAIAYSFSGFRKSRIRSAASLTNVIAEPAECSLAVDCL